MKKIIFKLSLLVFSIAILVFSIINLVDILSAQIPVLKDGIKLQEIYGKDDHTAKVTIEFALDLIVPACFSFLTSLLFFLVINIKGLQFVTVSTIQLIKEHKAKTSAERNAKKQAKLAREIAEKQAELDKMNNSTKE